MRLLTYDDEGELCITEDLADDDVPPYAILSHTWGNKKDEVTLNEIETPTSHQKPGYQKIEFCGQQARQDGWQHFWADTCCIDKSNHVELTRTITSMYRWYQQARVCYVYLSDVSYVQWKTSFRQSRWFTRGWTLQELLAPPNVVFYSKEGRRLGTKNELRVLLHDITGISTAALIGQPLSSFPVIVRMRWTQGRQTKERENQAYCLLGIFGVYMPLIYGEGDNAFRRLQKEIDAQFLTYDAGTRRVPAHQPMNPSEQRQQNIWAKEYTGSLELQSRRGTSSISECNNMRDPSGLGRSVSSISDRGANVRDPLGVINRDMHLSDAGGDTAKKRSYAVANAARPNPSKAARSKANDNNDDHSSETTCYRNISAVTPEVSSVGEVLETLPAQQRKQLSTLFKLRQGKADFRAFFVSGRVIAILWNENAGRSIGGKLPRRSQEYDEPFHSFASNRGERMYTYIRRFMLVKIYNGNVLAIPILTYGGRGCAAKSMGRREKLSHAIVFTKGQRPTRIADEPKFTKQPIEIDPAVGEPLLHKASRLHFGRMTSIDCNIEMKDCGMINDKKSRVALTRNVKEQIMADIDEDSEVEEEDEDEDEHE